MYIQSTNISQLTALMGTIMTVLFVAFSHTLTEAQKTDFLRNFVGLRYFEVPASDNGGIPSGRDGFEVVSDFKDHNFLTLKDVNFDLQAKASNVNPKASLKEIKILAKEIVSEALKNNATHFYLAGEPALSIHANLLAKRKGLVCVQSTTERKSSETVNKDGTVTKTAVFEHVQWRVLF